jgi:hypothetical protein
MAGSAWTVGPTDTRPEAPPREERPGASPGCHRCLRARAVTSRYPAVGRGRRAGTAQRVQEVPFRSRKPNPQRTARRPQTVHARYPAEGSDYGYMERSESLGGVSRWPSAKPDIDARENEYRCVA